METAVTLGARFKYAYVDPYWGAVQWLEAGIRTRIWSHTTSWKFNFINCERSCTRTWWQFQVKVRDSSSTAEVLQEEKAPTQVAIWWCNLRASSFWLRGNDASWIFIQEFEVTKAYLKQDEHPKRAPQGSLKNMMKFRSPNSPQN